MAMFTGPWEEPGVSSQCHAKLRSFNQRKDMTRPPFEKEVSGCVCLIE